MVKEADNDLANILYNDRANSKQHNRANSIQDEL